MSKTFHELDHRLNHHAKKPNPECPTCFPTLKKDDGYKEHEISPWDHVGINAPNFFPDVGTLWLRGDTTLVFIETEKGMGAWATPSQVDLLSVPTKESIEVGKLLPDLIQIEVGSGARKPTIKRMAITTNIPDESSLRSSGPMGVDIIEWTIEQNRAKLLRDIHQRGMFPVSHGRTRTYPDPSGMKTTVGEDVDAIFIPDASYLKTMPF
jgi:hypothetical protein